MSEPVDMQNEDIKAKVEALKAKLGLVTPESTEGLSEEAKAARVEADAQPDSSPITGKDVNWDDYELDERYKHFYPRAELVQVGEEMKWVVTIQEFHSASKAYSGTGLAKNGEPQGFGEYITWMTNGPEAWRIVAILPNGSGIGAVVLQRQLRVTLPDPVLIETKTEVATPTDEELAAEEAKGLEWAGVGKEAAEEAAEALSGPDFGEEVKTDGGVEGADVQ